MPSGAESALIELFTQAGNTDSVPLSPCTDSPNILMMLSSSFGRPDLFQLTHVLSVLIAFDSTDVMGDVAASNAVNLLASYRPKKSCIACAEFLYQPFFALPATATELISSALGISVNIFTMS